jgi:N-sulfoglucosamine sulfohydrolase
MRRNAATRFDPEIAMRLPLMFLTVGLLLMITGPARADRPKNVLVLIADDMGMTLGCYGDKIAQTPNLDKLSRRAVRFTRAYATTASCSPSRSTIYSGLFTHQNGTYGLQHPPHGFLSLPTVEGIPNLLRRAGYWTGIIAKKHVGPQTVYDWESEMKGGNGRDPVTLTKDAKAFLAQRKDRPFFLVVGFNDPHRSAGKFGNELFPNRPEEVRFDPAKIAVPPNLPDRPEVRQDLAEYYQSVARCDRAVGMILKELEDAGLLEDTLIFFLSDNGIPFPGAKTTLYDTGVHLPLLVACPGHRGGNTSNALVSFVDLVPTILDWTGAKGPKYKLPGRSMLPILDEENPKGWDAVFGSHQLHEITMYYPMRSITTERYRLIVNLDHQKDFPLSSDIWGSPTWQDIRKNGLKTMGQKSVDAFLQRPKEELYDLKNDPNENNNLASDSGHAEILADLRRRVRKMQADTNDPWQILYREEDVKFNRK